MIFGAQNPKLKNHSFFRNHEFVLRNLNSTSLSRVKFWLPKMHGFDPFSQGSPASTAPSHCSAACLHPDMLPVWATRSTSSSKSGAGQSYHFDPVEPFSARGWNQF